MISARYVRRKTRTTKEILSKFDGPKSVKVGFPAGKADGGVISKAIWNHYGTEDIPERPFISLALRKNLSKYKQAFRKGAAAILKGEYSISIFLQRLGILSQGHIQEEITNLSSPPNSPATIKVKGSSNPLIDSGEMRGSVTYKVEE